ncbi:hypothetical protein, partial [Bradyrhizobium sp. CCBAU 21359]|uniref:hypothetical protein n=1 Tax=Bradyrhizobium sp. CCBAU 21359 TaxID=1325080 RepID=UPI002305E8A0
MLRRAAAKNDGCCPMPAHREPASSNTGGEEPPLHQPIHARQEETMTLRKPITLSRRKLLMAGAAVPLCAILTRP